MNDVMSMFRCCVSCWLLEGSLREKALSALFYFCDAGFLMSGMSGFDAGFLMACDAGFLMACDALLLLRPST